MKWIKEITDLFKFELSNRTNENFTNYYNLLVMKRIRLISIGVFILTPFFLYYDNLLIIKGAKFDFTLFLIIGHAFCLLVSGLYLLFYNKLIKKNILMHLVPKIYTFLYVLIGALSSINSQRLTGNINSYIVMMLIAAALLTQRTIYMFLIYGINHLIFIIGMGIMIQDPYILITKHMNSMAMLGISFLFSVYNYRFLFKDYMNHIKLKQSEENFRWLFDMSPFPVFITHLSDGRILELSEKAKEFIGLHNVTEDINIKNFYMETESRERLKKELIQKGSVRNRIDKFVMNGELVWIYANHELIEYGEEQCIVSGIVDITELHKVEEELAKYASIDMLTGIYNRRMGIDKINELINCSKNDGREFILCFIDINDLKLVNDVYGHNEGDNYIKLVCELIKLELDEDDYFFRMGGDEFIIIFLDKESSEVEGIWAKIVKHFNELNANEYKITASHGLFHYKPGMEVTMNEIIEYADKMMYKEKQLYKEVSVSQE